MHMGWKSRGRGSSDFYQNPKVGGGGVNAFWTKLPGEIPYFGFYCIFINKPIEICLEEGALIALPHFPLPLPPSTPLYASTEPSFNATKYKLNFIIQNTLLPTLLHSLGTWQPKGGLFQSGHWRSRFALKGFRKKNLQFSYTLNAHQSKVQKVSLRFKVNQT